MDKALRKRINGIKLFLMDMDGTVYVGGRKIPGAFEALDVLREKGKSICYVTNNSSKSNPSYVARLASMGVYINENELYTSAQATCRFLSTKQKGKKVFLLATEDVANEFRSYGITLTENDPDIVVICFDTSLSYDRLYRACSFINDGKLYVASHPDNNCPAEGCPMPDVGSFIQMIKATLGKEPDIIIGKPYGGMAEAIVEKYGFARKEIAMVGDRLYTDILFGVDNGFNSILVLSGETTADMLASSGIRPTLVLDSFKDILEYID